MSPTMTMFARRAAKFTALCGSTSLLAMSSALPALAQAAAQTAQVGPEMVPEQVLVTGSLIHGTAAVGVPVTNLSAQDFTVTGATTTSDLFKTVPIANVPAFQSSTDAGSKVEQTQSINLFGLNSKGPRTLMMIDGMRYPGQGDSGCQIDPSIIPKLALDRLDILPDGASATYGSDAVAGVVNVILKRGFEGAVTEGDFGFSPDVGHDIYRGSVLYGTKWDSGDITLTYEYYKQNHVSGTARPYYTMNFNIAGLDNRTSITNSRPGTVSVGKPALPASNPNNGVNPVTNVPGIPGSFSATTGTSCANCYAIPGGQNGQGLTWAQILANPGTGNEINPFSNSWSEPDQARSAVVVTFDQNIMANVQFFADGFYDNRRSTILNATGPTSPAPAQNNALTVQVPTTNPFYPIGAPNNLQVSYDFGLESPVHIAGNELAGRYDAGFNIDLPFNWLGKIYGAVTQDDESAIETGLVNPGQVSAALGWTVPASAVLSSFAKPANVPYLNVFCDPTQFTCNNSATINFIQGHRFYVERDIIHEAGATADGSLFSLPGGDVKAAVGVVYDKYNYYDQDNENYNNFGTAQISNLEEYETREVYSTFAQLDVPIVGDANRLPFVERAEVQAAVRYDHYDAFGGTTNPKIAGDWVVADGLKLEGSWGTSFRVPSFQEAGFVSGTLIQPINQAAGGGSNNYGTCPKTGVGAVTGSAAALIDPNCSAASQFLGGIRLGNGAAIANAVRPGGNTLSPEKGQNVNAGFDWSPDDPWFRGLDLQANYYFIRIRDKLQGCSVGSVSGQLDDPNYAFCFITAANNPNFQTQVQSLLSNGRSQLPAGLSPTNIAFVADGAIRNIGWQSTNGVEFSPSYVYDAGPLGALNAGLTGYYVIDNKSVGGPGQPVISVFSSVQSGQRDSGGRMSYRARLGWASPDSAWNVTGFMNYFPHSFSNGTALGGSTGNGLALPPLCFLQGNPACSTYGPQFAQYTAQFPVLSNLVPGMYTFDLAVQYQTGDVPANRYLKNIGVTLAINNLLDKQPPFEYSVSTGSNTPHAFSNVLSADGRFITITVTKAW